MIGRLEDALAVARKTLEQSAAAERQLAADAAERDGRLERLANELETERQARAAQQTVLAELEARSARLDAELRTARADLAAELAKPRARSAEQRIQGLQEELAALTGYIANRRARWDELEGQLQTATVRIAELERELAHRAERQQTAEQVAQRESARAEALRRELIETSHTLADRDRKLAAARTDEQDPQRQVERLQEELERADELNARLQADLEAESRRVAALPAAQTEPADGALEIVAHLENELEHKRTQITALTIDSRNKAREAEGALADLAESRVTLDAARAEIEQQRADIGRLERALVERESALDSRNERLASLQRELDQKLGSLQRPGATDVALRDRDVPAALRAAQAETGVDTPALVCLTGDAPRQYALSKPMILIGRSSQCDIHVFTQFVSREHARLVIDRSRVVIEDLGSTNGVFVNSVRIDRQELRHGDLLTVGETQFRFLERMAH
jgi:DNA repair exonuclease SbcCD ATPase subunit